VDCPLDCEYLQEARKHDRAPLIDPAAVPNADIDVTERLIVEHEALLGFLSGSLLRAALETRGVIDYDVREALDALIRTYRTLRSGVYYETRPANPLAAGVYAELQRAIEEWGTEEQKRLGMHRTRDAEILGLLVFLQRIELDRNNGRRRGRAFLDSLRRLHQASTAAAPAEPSSLILP
jgi:hypothetical protein